MRINHNISALNAWRNLSGTDNVMSKSLEKLSSGLRINRAADDAAGLAISEKMRAQIKGLEMAQRNAQDAISLIQTAEGALNESHSILQRMRELAVQASSDSLTDADRSQIQEEVDALIDELDRIGNTTEFNSKKLLDGSAAVSITEDFLDTEATKFSATGDTQTGSYTFTALTAAAAASRNTTQDAPTAITSTDAIGSASTLTINGVSLSFAATDTYADVQEAINAQSSVTGVTVSFNDAQDRFQFQTTEVGSTARIEFSNATGIFGDGGTTEIDTTTPAVGTDASLTTQGGLYDTDYVASGNRIEFVKGDLKGLTFNVVGSLGANRTLTIGTNGSLTFQIGANSGQTMNVSVGDMRASALGVDALTVASKDGAQDAIDALDAALDAISTQRSALGAIQNRLEHTIANLGTAAENLTAAESRIRDVDMALEMANFTRSQILLQSGSAMLAQANQKPQAVLQLLQ